MALGSGQTKMEINMKVNSKKIRKTGKEPSSGLTAICTKVSFATRREKARVKCLGMMGVITKEIGKMEIPTA